MDKEIINLYDLQTKLKEGIEGIFPSGVWLRAEISSLILGSGGHCYMELSQSGGDGPVAKVRAVIWSFKFRVLEPYFEQVTGSSLQAGINVLFHVQVSYSQLYGLSLTVDNIDPEYTLGEREKLRRETISRLESEGLMQTQKALKAAVLPRRLAIISASTAAGYGDFMKHLNGNPYGFTFFTELFPALMQGASCPESIISAMEDILLSDKDFDMVLILRGGGSDLDLACFDDYRLCAAIARFPKPVYTAIGHDRDYHIADMVAFGSVKTPTALADMVVDWVAAEDARIEGYATRLKLVLSGKISAMENRLAVLDARIRSALTSKISAMESRLAVLDARIRSALAAKISAMESRLAVLDARIRSALTAKISAMESRLAVLETRIKAADPRSIIARGYILALDGQGVAFRNARDRKPGDRVSLMFSDGVLRCTVDGVESAPGAEPSTALGTAPGAEPGAEPDADRV